MALRNISKGRTDLLWFSSSQLKIQPGWNERTPGEALEKHIEAIKESILANGFLPTEPLAIQATTIDGVEHPVVRDGHNRLEAVKRAEAETGREILIPCLPVQKGSNEFDTLKLQWHSNSGLNHSIPEKVRLLKRMAQERPELNEAGLAKALGVSVTTITDYLTFLEAPDSLQRMAESDRIAPTEVIQIVKTHGTGQEAVEIATTAIEIAVSEGKSKASKKHRQKAIQQIEEGSSTLPLAETNGHQPPFPTSKKVTLKQFATQEIYGSHKRLESGVIVELDYQTWQQFLDLIGIAEGD